MARFHHHPLVAAPLAALVTGYLRMVCRTGQWQILLPEATAAMIRDRRPVIGVFWHGRMMMMAPAWDAVVAASRTPDPIRPCVISSDHADSFFVARVTARFGLAHAHGSNKRGGIAIFRAALRVLSRGGIAVLTPDGPRGPARQVKPGVAHIALRTGAPVLPITFAASRARILGSWDRLIVPLPFTRGVFALGAPVVLPAETDPETARAKIEGALNALDETAEAMLREPVAVPAA